MSLIVNLVTVLVVVAILIIYRQIDRNSRALDKVKRYSDRVIDRLSAFIDEKTGEIKDLAIEVQVNLKTGKEVLKRVRTVEEGLEAKAAQVDVIEQRLNGYDVALSELARMSERVDENLKRLREESEFVAGVGKKVRSAADQLKTLRQEYPKLQAELHEKDREQIGAIKRQVVADAERVRAAIAARLTEVQGVTEDLERRSEQLAAERERFEEESGSRLAERLQQMEGKVLAAATQAEARAVAAAADTEDRVAVLVTDAEARSQTAVEVVEQQARAATADGEKRMAAAATAAASRAQEATAESERRVAAAATQAESRAQEAMAETESKLGEAAAEAESRAQEATAAVEARTSAAAAEAESRAQEAATDTEALVTAAITAAEQRMETATSASAERIATAAADTETRLRSIAAGSEAQITAAAGDAEKRATTVAAELEQRAEYLEQHALQEAAQLETEVVERLTALRQETVAQVTSVQRQCLARVADLEEQTAGRVETLREQAVAALTELRAQAVGDIEVRAQESSAALAQAQSQTTEHLDEHLQSVEEKAAASLGHAQQRAGQIEQRITQLQQRTLAALDSAAEHAVAEQQQAADALAEAAERAATLQDEAFAAIAARVAQSEGNLAERLQSAQDRLESAIVRNENHDQRLHEIERSFGAATEALTKRAEQHNRQHQTQLAESAAQAERLIDARIAELQQETQTALEATAAGLERELLERSAARLADLEAEVGERLTKVEGLQGEFVAFETAFRQSLESKGAWLREQLEARTQSLIESHADQLTGIGDRFVSAQAQLAELEESLATIKAAAHQEVSDRLQVFEQDFAADLAKRGRELERRLGVWQESLLKRTEQITDDNLVQRDRLLDELRTELRDGVEKLRGRTAEELDRIETVLTSFEDGLQARLRGADNLIADEQTRAREELEAARNEAHLGFARGIDEVRDDLTQQFQQSRRQLQDELTQIDDAARERYGELRSGVEATQAELELQIEALRSTFATERTELVDESTDERDRLRMELKAIAAAVEQLTGELDEKSTATASNFAATLREHETAFRARIDTALEELADDSERIRENLDNARAQAETAHAGMVRQIEQDSSTLAAAVADTDRRLRGFLEQTKLIERADTLREDLQQRIEELEERIAKIHSHREDLQAIHTELQRAQKVADDVTARLGRFQAEKRRIETMEGDFKKLINISRDVDVKLESIDSSREALQEIQVKIRSLQELETTVTGSYQRLEKRQEVLDATVAGVDRSFARLQELEQTIEAVQPGISGVTAQVDELTKRVEVLGAGRERAERVIKTIEGVDTLLEDLEERSERMQAAREWLARTETRLEEIGSQAQEQVQLLETLLKADGNTKGGAEDGAPPLGKRETVVKLAHQGWSVPEIARATKLSRGEVELILEVSSNGQTAR